MTVDMNDISLQMFFDGWASLIRTVVLGTLSYVFLIFILRLSGKRTLTKMNSFDFVITVAFGSTMASILTSKDASLAQGVVALALLVLLQFVVTFFAVRSDRIAQLVKASPALVYYRGRFLDKPMKKERINRDEVLAAIRQEGVVRPDEVDAVVLETDGSLSVIKKGAASPESLRKYGVSPEPAVGSEDL